MTPEEQAFMIWLRSQGALDPKPIGNGFYAAIRPFAFTQGLIVGEIGDFTGYIDRWCYRNYATAKAALDAWEGEGEPTGWHRHPASGRRICYAPNTYDDQGRIVPIGEMYHYA